MQSRDRKGRFCFNHYTPALSNGYHPKRDDLVLAEIEPYHSMYILSIRGHKGSALISEDDAMSLFGDQMELEFAYIPDDILNLGFTLYD